jgi:hypothetical protein
MGSPYGLVNPGVASHSGWSLASGVSHGDGEIACGESHAVVDMICPLATAGALVVSPASYVRLSHS